MVQGTPPVQHYRPKLTRKPRKNFCHPVDDIKSRIIADFFSVRTAHIIAVRGNGKVNDMGHTVYLSHQIRLEPPFSSRDARLPDHFMTPRLDLLNDQAEYRVMPITPEAVGLCTALGCVRQGALSIAPCIAQHRRLPPPARHTFRRRQQVAPYFYRLDVVPPR